MPDNRNPESMKKEDEEVLICGKCGLDFTLLPITLAYLGHNFDIQVPGCKRCGQIYLSEELVAGKIAQLEIQLEEK